MESGVLGFGCGLRDLCKIETYPLVPSLAARIQLLSKVPQVVVVVEVEHRNQILKCMENEVKNRQTRGHRQIDR